jgi:hypothetical protein
MKSLGVYVVVPNNQDNDNDGYKSIDEDVIIHRCPRLRC